MKARSPPLLKAPDSPRELDEPHRVTLDTSACGDVLPTTMAARIAVSLTPLPLEADSRAFKVAQSLRRLGYRSIVLEGARSRQSFTIHGLDVRALGPPPSQSPRRDSIHRLRHGAWGALGHYALLAGFAGRFASRYLLKPFLHLPRADLYYVHSYEYLPLVLARRGGAHIVYDAHDFYQNIVPRHLQPEFDHDYLMPLLARLERAVARRCNAVVTVSNHVADAISGAMSVRAHVLVNAVDSRTNVQVARDMRSILGLSPEHALLVMVGNRKVGLPIDFVAAMLRSLPAHVHIAFLGRGYETDESLCRASGLRGRLHFLGAVPAVHVTSFIARADAGILLYLPISLNYRGALPNGFFHLLDAGLPIARFPLPEVEAAIGQAPVGPILDPRNPIEAAATLAHFLGDMDARRRAVAASSALGRSLTWAAQEQVLREIVEHGAADKNTNPGED